MGFKKNSQASSFFKDLQARPFESQVWFVVAAIAGLRALKAVVQDLIGNTNPSGLVIDMLILLIFCGLCFLIYLKKIPRIPLIVGVMLLILLAFSYVQFGGVLGMTEYNVMGLGVLFALAYSRKKLVLMMTLYFVVIVLANLDLRIGGWLTQSFFKRISTGLDNYLTTLFTLLVIILYFKKALIRESDRITELGNRLARQIKTIKIQKKELYEQKELLRNINARLEQDIRNHSDQIVRQNNAMKDYIWLSTESLQIPLKRLSANVSDLNENSLLEIKLKEQIDEFNVVIHNLTSELVLHQNTDKPYGDHSTL